jgi:asparagine synthase (glutamine-hydrolysing)
LGNAIAWSLATPRGMAITHPFLDARVLRLGLGIQMRFTPLPGRLKPILVEAMRDILPDVIRNRRSKGHFNEVYYLGLSRNLAGLESMIHQAPCDDLGMLDKNQLIEGLHKAALGGAGARPLQHLNLMLALLKWLSMQQEWQTIQDRPPEIVRL